MCGFNGLVYLVFHVYFVVQAYYLVVDLIMRPLFIQALSTDLAIEYIIYNIHRRRHKLFKIKAIQFFFKY